MHETGHFTDPFDYTSLLAISDCRLHIARARCPKPVSLRNMLLGPRTFGFRCMHLQDCSYIMLYHMYMYEIYICAYLYIIYITYI